MVYFLKISVLGKVTIYFVIDILIREQGFNH